MLAGDDRRVNGRADLLIPSMPFGWIGQTAKLAAAQGIDIIPTLDALNIGGMGPLEDASPMGPQEAILMGALVINGIDDELHGMTRKRMERGTSNLMVQAATSAVDLKGAITSFVRFFALIHGQCDVRLESDAVNARISIRTKAPKSSAVHAAEEMHSVFLHAQLSTYLNFFLPLTAFVTPARDHPLLSRRHSYFLCPVVSGTVTTLVFPASYLPFCGRSAPVGNPVLHGQLQWLSFRDEVASGSFNRDPDEDTLGSAVFRLLSDDLVGLDACCAGMSLTERQLRYGLWQEGTTFRRIRQAVLLKRGREELSDGASVDDVAEGLRYSDARSLRRALKSAGGMSISELRDGVRGAGGEPTVMDRLRTEIRRLV